AAAYYIWHIEHPAVPPAPPVTLPAADTAPQTLTYYCDGGKTMQAVFKNAADPAASSTVELALSDGRTFDLPQQISGSGMRYEAASTRYGTDVAFIGKGDQGFLTENGKTTYADCTAADVTASDAPGYALYTDIGKTFSFAFPLSFTVAGSAVGFSPGWTALENSPGMVLAKIVVPAGYASSTNFGSATFTVGVSSDPSAVAACLKTPAGATATTTKVGDVIMTELTGHDAGAGQRYDTESYRAVHDNECYAVEYTIRYGVLANFPKGTKPFDEATLAAALDEVARSFIFLQ
ncbi:MAG: MliC family protein, partial [Patescibacteria group bacterium]|nr:MliC family protein [Patescibacteria group bacterium]